MIADLTPSAIGTENPKGSTAITPTKACVYPVSLSKTCPVVSSISPSLNASFRDFLSPVPGSVI